MPDEQIEEHIALTQPDGFEQTTSGDSVTGKHVFADVGDPKEKEANILSQHAGASSEAPPSSGIPSAMTQSGMQREAVAPQKETSRAGRVKSLTQNLEP